MMKEFPSGIRLKAIVEDDDDSEADYTSSDDGTYFLELDSEFEKGPVINNDLAKDRFVQRIVSASILAYPAFANHLFFRWTPRNSLLVEYHLKSTTSATSTR